MSAAADIMVPLPPVTYPWQSLSRLEANTLYAGVLHDRDTEAMRQLCLHDLFFLLTVACKRRDVDRDWLYARCREVEISPDGHLDCWGREHYKSTIITFGRSIQDILQQAEHDHPVVIGIFSHTRPIAKAFLKQIKLELESNTFLKGLFPDVLYANPEKESPSWSLDNGITTKRKSNPKENTVEAWGLVDGQPTSKHFTVMVYDDVVTRESVSTPEQIDKTTEAWGLSLSLGAAGGKVRYVGTRYHFNDTWKTIMDRKAAAPRIYPATVDGSPEGDPVLMTREELDKRRQSGPYVFACHVRGTRVLMADWSWKNIEDLAIGDSVVGYTVGQGRTKLVPSKVLAKVPRRAEARKYTLASGDSVSCTPDHKWWTGRTGADTHRVYAPLGDLQGKDLRGLVRIAYEAKPLSQADQMAACWLGGIFDGEGSAKASTCTITQSRAHNPEVHAKIQSVLNQLGFEFVTREREAGFRHGCNHKGSTTFCLLGGRYEKHRFLQITDIAKRDKFTTHMFGALGNKSKSDLDRVVSWEALGEQEVWNIQTETGNYVANGFASKNCQYLQNPIADEAQGFKAEWLQYYGDGGQSLDARQMNIYAVVDAANEKKSHNDYTVQLVIGLAPDGNRYLLHAVRDRMNLTERTESLFRIARRFRLMNVGYEQYGMMADIDHIKYVQGVQNYRFPITRLGGAMPKNDRIRRLIPEFEQGRFWIPRRLLFRDLEGKSRDFVREFIDDEYLPFPVGLHDDMLDCMARIMEPELNAVFPRLQPLNPLSGARQSRPMAHDAYEVLPGYRSK